MRRYFSILAVAMATILLCSCEFAEADSPDPQRANKLLWGRVEEGLHFEYRHAQVVAHLNDVMLSRTQLDAAYDKCEISDKDGIYTLDYSGSKYGSQTYRILTNGKRLDEGGEWSIYVKYGSYMEFVYIGSAKGIVGQSNKFTIKTGNPEWYHFDYFVSQESVVEYSIDEISEVLTLLMTSATGLNTDDLQNPESANYTIDYKLLKPLRFEKDELISGKVDIVYRDVQAKSQRTVVVDIENKIVTFMSNK